MEVDSRTRSVLAPVGTVPSVMVALHPLVLMNISEHWTRTRAQNGKSMTVFGAVIGKQIGRSLEVLNSFELVVETDTDGKVSLDQNYYETKSEQFKQVFPDFELLGWYTTGGTPTEADTHFHQQICQLNESPILVKLDPQLRHSESLPIKCYESMIDIINGSTVMLLVELQYTLATEEAERIGVDHVARASSLESSSSSGEDSVVTQHLTAQYSAIKMLASRIKVITAYLQAVSNGELEVNHEILRECNSMCHRLPILNTPAFKDQFYNQCNDVELLAYLGVITQGCNVMNQFVSKFNILYDRVGPGGGRRVRGGLFS